MTADEAGQATRRARKPKARRFDIVSPLITGGRRPGYVIENEAKLDDGPGLGPPPDSRGFPDYPEPPRLLIGNRFGRPLRDLELCSDYWLISGAMKRALEAADPVAFAFVRCDAWLTDGTPGPEFWLCDVLPILDALDEQASRLRIYDEPDGKTYNLMGGASLVFREDVIGPAHIFRMAHMEPAVICDQHLKDACTKAGLKGIKLQDALDL